MSQNTGKPDIRLEDNPYIASLRDAGAKITPQRIAICQWLTTPDIHPTASEVYEALSPRFPTMSIATIYNALRLLSSMGLIQEIASAVDGSTRYDPDTAVHMNLVCMECDRVTNSYIDVGISEPPYKIGEFTVEKVNLLAYGVCASCS